MIQLSNIFKKVKLITNLQFLFHQKPRQSSVPTQASTLLPFNINCLHDNPGARRYPPIIGRGPGSGRGKTAGRGHKGNKARQGGGVHVRFEGGQTPISRRLPKYGRVVQRRPQQYFNYVNLQNIVYFIKRNIINPNELITLKVLNDCGLIKKVKSGVKILGRGAQKVTFPIKLEATDASKSVIEAVKNAGGQIRLVHRTPLKLRQHLYPQKYPLPLRQPITPAWKARALQRKAEHRGIEYIFNKPKWMLLNQVQEEKPKSNFIFPVPRIPNSGKIRQRKAKLYKKINYNL